ncbi:phage virion morphogenesis protein [Novosphingobium naphthalenivorans]|uniref:phage virion morphogenesis protein n=1 Tax=Novosphingobium naphthalenivorans TaxID=273168 RepID=UPI0008346D76|nr:phage virion morphogenesis protein [Novosphingobium naphthalenivorans]
MAGAAFQLTAAGDHRIELALGGLVEAFGDLTPLMEGFGLTLESGVTDRFDTETAPNGSKWERSQRVKKHGGKTLTLSAQLRSSMHSIASSTRVETGTNKVYAGVHNDGFDGTVTVPTHSRTIDEAFGRPLRAPITFTVQSFERAMHMPQRQFLGLSSEDEAELLAQAEDYARDAWGPEA